MSAYVVGGPLVVGRLNVIVKQINAAVIQELRDAALDLKSKSIARAPIQYGDLRGSCGIDDSQIEQGTVEVFYATDYAVVQHETMEFNHPQGGEAKYLENPFNENEARYRANIELAARRVVG